MGIIQYSEESLKFQPPTFFKHLTMLYEELVKIKDIEKLAGSELWGAVEETIFDFTGIKVAIVLDSQGPGIELPNLDRNNILINSWRRPGSSSTDGIRLIKDSKDAISGWTDEATGKIGGVFSKITHRLHINELLFNGSTPLRFTPEEFAGITIHELGHIYTFYRYIGFTASTNQVLAGMSRALHGASSPEQREVILKLAADEVKLRGVDFKELSQSSDNRIIEYVFISSAIREGRSELGSSYYDLSQAEQLADEYAARWQAHRATVTALDKIERDRPFNSSYRSWTAFFLLEAVKIGMLMTTVAAIPLVTSPAVLGNVITGRISAWAGTMYAILIAADGRGNGEYDRPAARFKRLRNQVVEQLKNKDLSKDQISQLREDLLEIDNITKFVEDKDQLVNVLWDFLSSASRQRQSETKLQRDLEDIANNEIFVQSAALRQLA